MVTLQIWLENIEVSEDDFIRLTERLNKVVGEWLSDNDLGNVETEFVRSTKPSNN